MGLALGGAAGTRLGSKIGLAASRNTLLRLVRQEPLPTMPAPSVLGVDDWAVRKRQTTGLLSGSGVVDVGGGAGGYLV